MRNDAEGVGVYSDESGEDNYPNATGWTIDAEYALFVMSGPKIIAYHKPESWQSVRDLGFERIV